MAYHLKTVCAYVCTYVFIGADVSTNIHIYECM